MTTPKRRPGAKRAPRPIEIPTAEQRTRAELLYRFVTTDPKAIGAEVGLRHDTVERMAVDGVWWLARQRRREAELDAAEKSAAADELAVRAAQERHREQLRTALEITGYSLEAIGAALAKGEDIPGPVRSALRLLPGIDKLVVTDRLAHGLTTDKASDADSTERYYAAVHALAAAADRAGAGADQPDRNPGDLVPGDAGLDPAPGPARIPPAP